MSPFDARLVRHARAARGYLICTVGVGLVTTALVLAQAGLLARVLAGAARGAGLGALAGALLSLLIVVLCRAAAAFGSEAASLHAAAVVKSQLRTKLTAHALRLGPAWLGGQQAGEITMLATKGLDALDAYFARYLPQLVLGCLVPIAVLIRVTAADWISGLVIAATLPLIPVFGVLVGLHAKARTQEQWGALARLGGHFLDVVEGLPTLKVFGRAKAQAAEIRRATGEYRTATMSALRIAFLSALVLELAAALATALVAVEVGLRLLAGHIGYETALLVLLLTPEAYLPLRNIGAQFHASVEGTTAAGRVFEILDSPLPGGSPGRPHAASAPDKATVPDLSVATIELRTVTLAYPGRPEPALRDVTATISPGERLVLCGPSGAGKSSLLGLLLRFSEPTSGHIEAAGTDLAAIPADRWRRQIAWVPQRPYLFAGTIAENIALGDPAATPAAISRAARLAGAESFILSLTSGFGTRLSERGLTLSAGQRQRIALARAFLRDAPLVLLDEPAAHLDPATASQIMVTIEALTAGRTVVLISHGERAPEWADRVLRLDQGRLDRGRAQKARLDNLRLDQGRPDKGQPAAGLSAETVPTATP
ncbi:MAG: thiol reductant ABC exporter subunit CydD [Streptosporangiaceae bacterium]